MAPLVALVVASALQAYAALNRAADAGRVKQGAAFAVSVNALVHELQRERGLSGGYVGSGYQTGLDKVTAQRTKADEALNAFDTQAVEVRSSHAAASAQAALGDAETALQGLAGQRRAIDRKALDVAGTLSYYTGTIAKLLAVDRAMSTAIDDPEAAQIATAFVDLSESKEFTALERGFMNSVFSAGRFGPGDYGRLLTLVAEQDAWSALFRSTADPAVVRYADQQVTGPAVKRAAELRAQALAEGADGRELTVGPAEWWSVMTTKIDLMRDVELRLTEDLRGRADAVSTDANAALARDVTATLVVMGLSLALSAVTARRMARRLRRLRDAAHAAADVRLPAVVAALGEGRDVDVAKETEPVHIDTDDEIGETAHAFTRVHSVAVQLTVEQAGLRRSLSDTLLNLARRSQTLIHQQLELIDEMEHSESDGTKLASLFRIDHIATRMRRHTEDLIVLSGATPSRGWSAPVLLRDVVRGAIAEVESYSRVKAVRLPEIAVVGHAVGDLLHLLAELIENGTRFSPPDAPVLITAGEVGKGYVIEIEDRGLGMIPSDMARHNERLDDPPAFDLSTSDRLGLHVVARLAARHSIRVCLRDSVFGGVTAVVLVGHDLIRPVEDVPGAEHEAPDTGASGMPDRGAAGGAPQTAGGLIGDEGRRAGAARPGGGTGGWDRLAAAPARAAGVLDAGAGRTAGMSGPRPQLAAAGGAGGRALAASVDLGPAGTSGDRRPTSPPSSASRVPGAGGAVGSHPPGRAAGGPAEAVPDGMTADGLPRRVPRKHLTAELRREPEGTIGGIQMAGPLAAPSSEAAAPSPEEIRAMLSGYQAGFDRGQSDRLEHQAAQVGGQAYDHWRRRPGAQRDVDDRDVDDRNVGPEATHTVADRVLDYPTKVIRRSLR